MEQFAFAAVTLTTHHLIRNSRMTNKLNPDSVMLAQLDGHWQKVATFILWKIYGVRPVTITAKDIEKINAEYPNGPILAVVGNSDSMTFQLVTEEQAKIMAAHDKTLRGNA